MSELESSLLRLIEQGVEQPLSDEEFNALALRLFRHQCIHTRCYGELMQSMDASPEALHDWRQIPPLPVDSFKWARLTSVSEAAPCLEFRTSGTSRGGTPGRHILPDDTLYRAAMLAGFRAYLLPDEARLPLYILGPSAAHFPHSSLGHMLSGIAGHLAAPGGGVFWGPEGGRFADLAEALRAECGAGRPVMLAATAFAMVHFLDYLRQHDLEISLPAGSRLMDTGGFKGRSREVPRHELYAAYRRRLGLPLSHVVNEYGMTELGSQFYDNCLRGAGPSAPGERVKEAPPWARVRLLDADSLQPVSPGKPGVIALFDLINLHTISALLTEDLGIERDGGFEILGRVPGAEARGCSLEMER